MNTISKLRFNRIKNEICEYFDIDQDIIFSKTRKSEIVFARQIFVYFVFREIRALNKMHVSNDFIHKYIASEIGFDRGTVRYYSETTIKNYSFDVDIRSAVKDINILINSFVSKDEINRAIIEALCKIVVKLKPKLQEK